MKWLPLFAVLSIVGCSCGGHREVRWPASADVRLRDELSATALAEGEERVLLPSGERIAAAEQLPADAPGIRARSFAFEGLWVAEIELGDVAVDEPLPLVIMFHGRGDRPRIPGGPLGRVPTPMRVLVPRGPLALGSGYAWARHSVTENRHDELASDLCAVSDELARLIEEVRRTRPTLGTPIVTGFSQGGMVAWTLAVRYPEQVGLAIPIAGWVPPAARPPVLRAPPTSAIHGTDDAIVRIQPTRDWVATLRGAGQTVAWREFDGVAHVVTAEMNQLFETWLEEALQERAPSLTGGLGEPGIGPDVVEPFEEPIDIDPGEQAVPAPLPDLEPIDASGDLTTPPTPDPPVSEEAQP